MAPPITVPVGPAPVQVYTPQATGRPHAVIFNSGPATVFLGQSGVTEAAGFPLPPNAGLDLAFAPIALFAACGGIVLSGSVVSNIATAVTGGTSTTIVVASTTGFAAGQVIQVGSGPSLEMLTVLTAITGTITPTSKPLYDHVVGEPVTLVTGSAPGTLRVTAGVT